MGNNNSMVSVMFEEIKGLLTSIEKKLNERAPVKESLSPQETMTEPKSEAKINTVKPEQLFRLITVYLQETERKISQVSETIRESEMHVLSQMEELKQITIRQKPDSKVRHYHIIDLKSPNVVFAIALLSLLLLGSFIGNIYQIIQINQIEDNDLKYRYVKSKNGISPENLYKLEEIFHYRKDEKLIREVRQNVEDYERRISEIAEKIDRERITDVKTKNK